ncbi:MAG: type I restriction enzyme HsdR N-terminal domain-containing protein [Dehalococcoidia bacterium]
MPVEAESLAATVQTALAEVVREFGTVTELNETETRVLLIDPVLHGLGYVGLDRMRREYRLKTSGQVVDYLLRAGDTQIVTEAKAGTAELTAKDAAQLVGYCAQEGIRWALLTNGLRWQVFDINVAGDWQSKRVTQVDLLEGYRSGAMSFCVEPLCLFAWDVLEGDERPLKTWAQQQRTRRRLLHLLTDPGSPVVDAIVKALAEEHLLLEPADVVTLLRTEGLDQPTGAPPPRSYGVPEQNLRPPPAPPVRAEGVSYYLFPAGKGQSEQPSVEHLRRWLDRGFWGLHGSTAHRTSVRPGDRCCFYATGVGIVATAEVTGWANSEVHHDEWPDLNPWERGVYKLPMSNITWLRGPVLINVDMRARLDAFRGKSPLKLWSWFVQTTRKLTEHDFRLLSGL